MRGGWYCQLSLATRCREYFHGSFHRTVVVVRFGVSWQVIPRRLNELLRDADHEPSVAVMGCMLQQVKLDVAELEAAYASHGSSVV